MDPKTRDRFPFLEKGVFEESRNTLEPKKKKKNSTFWTPFFLFRTIADPPRSLILAPSLIPAP